VPSKRRSTPLERRFAFVTHSHYNRTMKTSLELDDELLAQAKALAAREGTTIDALIEEGLRLFRPRQLTPSPETSGA
jgi:predicted DNA-binding ribbon-helix-helix protein